MISMDEVFEEAKKCGFDQWAALDPQELVFMQEVRDMCSADLCHKYGTNWTCPPGCGPLDQLRDRALKYKRGILVQSVGQMEDDFDMESMYDTEEVQKTRFEKFSEWLRSRVPDCMPMGAGTCLLCKECTYPHSPCRHPDRAVPSMEACGLLVTDVCKKAGMKYYYGPCTITFTSCALID